MTFQDKNKMQSSHNLTIEVVIFSMMTTICYFNHSQTVDAYHNLAMTGEGQELTKHNMVITYHK